jgi:hypothetical protein
MAGAHADLVGVGRRGGFGNRERGPDGFSVLLARPIAEPEFAFLDASQKNGLPARRHDAIDHAPYFEYLLLRILNPTNMIRHTRSEGESTAARHYNEPE